MRAHDEQTELQTELHQQILENAYLYLEVMDKVGKRVGIERRSDIPGAIARAEEHLQNCYSGKPLRYEDYQDITELTRDIGRQIWNPKGNTAPERLAVVGPSENAMAWRIDHEPEADISELPQPLWKRLLHERAALLEMPTDNLTPLDKMQYEMSLVSVNAGLEAFERLGDIELAALSDAQVVANRKLPHLNVQFVSEPALRVWANCTATLGGLPTDRDILMAPLNDVERGGLASKAMRERVAKAWSENQPHLSPEWVDHATQAIFGSATATSLETLDMSAATFVRQVFESTYDQMESASLKKRSEDASHEIEESEQKLMASLESIEDTLKHLKDHAAGRFPAALLNKIQAEATHLRGLVEASKYNQDDHDDLSLPSL